MQENENKSGAIKWIIIVIAMILIILLGIILLMTVGKDTGVAKSIGNAFPFGALSPEAPRDGFTETNGDGSGDGDASGVDTLTEPLFRQLTNEQIAGATTVERDGYQYDKLHPSILPFIKLVKIRYF